MQPTRDRVKSIENLRYWSGKPNQESNSLSKQRLTLIVKNNVIYYNICEEKDGLKSIKVYKFNNTKESWHEFALKFMVTADNRGYDDIIEGIETPPDEKEELEILDKDDAAVKKAKKEKQFA